MKAQDILNVASSSGVELWTDGETLRYRGNEQAVGALLPVLREHKNCVLELLSRLTAEPSRSVAPELAPVLRWLVYIGETDRGIIAEVLQRCRDDREARAYFLRRATEVPSLVKAGNEKGIPYPN